jgi:hypothetical protein
MPWLIVPPFHRTPQKVYDCLNKALKVRGFEFDKYFRLGDCGANKGEDFCFPIDTIFSLGELGGIPCIFSYSESTPDDKSVFLCALPDAHKKPRVVRTMVDVIKNLLNGWGSVPKTAYDPVPDFGLREEYIQNFVSSDLLPLGRWGEKWMIALGLQVYKLSQDGTDIPVEHGIFNHDGPCGVKKADWDSFLDTDKAVEYLSARLIVSKAVRDLGDDFHYLDQWWFSTDEACDERTSIEFYLSGKPAPDNNNLREYLPDLVDEFLRPLRREFDSCKIDSCCVKWVLAKHFGSEELTNYFRSINGLMIPSEVSGEDAWSTKTLPPNARQAAEWLIANHYDSKLDVRDAFFARQTSSRSDVYNAEDQANDAIVRVAEKYRRLKAEKAARKADVDKKVAEVVTNTEVASAKNDTAIGKKMIPPYGRTPQEVYNDLNEELKTRGFEIDKYFELDDCGTETREEFHAYRFANDTSFFLESFWGRPRILFYDESLDYYGAVFLKTNYDAYKENPQVVRTIATVTEQLLNGWQYDESLAPTANDEREYILFWGAGNKPKFCIKDGDYVRIQDKSDPNDYADVKCRQVNGRHGGEGRVRVCDYPLMDGDYGMREFALVLENINKQVVRLPARKPAYDVAFTPDGINFEWKEAPIADKETMLKNLVGDVFQSDGAQDNERGLFQGTKGTALFGLTHGRGHYKLTSLHPNCLICLETETRLRTMIETNTKVAKKDTAIGRFLSSVFGRNKTTASNTETTAKVASAKKDTGRGR